MYFNRCFLKDVAANVYIYIMAYNALTYGTDGLISNVGVGKAINQTVYPKTFPLAVDTNHDGFVINYF